MHITLSIEFIHCELIFTWTILLIMSLSAIMRTIAGLVATALGAYVVMDTGKDLEFVKYTPHSPQEVERRKKENVGMSLKQLETCTLDYKPEAKERLKRLMQEEELKRKGTGASELTSS